MKPPTQNGLPAWTRIAILGGLTLLTWAVFGQTLTHDFVGFDDSGYVYQNEIVSRGVTLEGLKAAFLQPHARNWHPLTTISHMIDCQLFGLDPTGHHLVNVLFHVGAALLLFEVLRAATGRTWPAVLVALLFAIHPLRAESVAWVAERKDVLSAFLFMIATGSYISYARNPSPIGYIRTCLLLLLGLMAKSMLVTLPILFFLLDFWPLQRRTKDGDPTGIPIWLKLLIEKIPMVAIALISMIATLLAQRYTVGYGATLPFYWRAGNSLCSLFIYIGQMLWPVNLAAFYPYPAAPLPGWIFAALATAVVGLTTGAFLLRHTRPWIMVGWSWYLISLIPVIGLVQVGLQAHADRYTYLPQIGLYIIIAWEAADLLSKVRPARYPLFVATSAVVYLLAHVAWVQTGTWKNTETLWEHAAAVNPRNVLAQYSVAGLREGKGDSEGAIAHYKAALQFASVHAVEVGQPHVAFIHNGLGNAFLSKGDLSGAMAEYRQAILFKPDFADAHSNLASVLVRKGEYDAARVEYEITLALPPEDIESHLALGSLLLRQGETAPALSHFTRALELQPDSPRTLLALANALVVAPDAALRDPERALLLVERARKIERIPNEKALRIGAAAQAQLSP